MRVTYRTNEYPARTERRGQVYRHRFSGGLNVILGNGSYLTFPTFESGVRVPFTKQHAPGDFANNPHYEYLGVYGDVALEVEVSGSRFKAA
jgi:hypothetical protein